MAKAKKPLPLSPEEMAQHVKALHEWAAYNGKRDGELGIELSQSRFRDVEMQRAYAKAHREARK